MPNRSNRRRNKRARRSFNSVNGSSNKMMSVDDTESLRTQEERPAPPAAVNNNDMDDAIGQLTIAIKPLPDSISNNMTENANVMLDLYAKYVNRVETLERISTTDSSGETVNINSVSTKKDAPCPVTCTRFLKDDDEAKSIIDEDLALNEEFRKKKKELIVRMATREVTARKEQLRQVIYDNLKSMAIDWAIYEREMSKVSGVSSLNALATDERVAHAAVAKYLSTLLHDTGDANKLFHENGTDMANRYSDYHNVVLPDDFKQLLSDDMYVPMRVSHIAEKLHDYFPKITLSFWREHDLEEIKRKINKQVTIRTVAAKQEKAQADVAQALEQNVDGDLPQAAIFDAHKGEVQKMINDFINANEQKKKDRNRKKSSGKPAQKDQASEPTSNGQSKSNKSKEKLSKPQQNLKELRQQQQSGSKPKGSGTVKKSRGGGGQQSGGRGGQSGRGRGNQGGSNNGKGKGRGGGGGRK